MRYKCYYCDSECFLKTFLESYTTYDAKEDYDFAGDTNDIIFKDDGIIRYNFIEHWNGSITYERRFAYWSHYAFILENNETYIIRHANIDTKKKLKEFKSFIANVDKKVDEYINLDAIIF